MSIFVNDSGTLKEIDKDGQLFARADAGTLFSVNKVIVNDGGTLATVWNAIYQTSRSTTTTFNTNTTQSTQSRRSTTTTFTTSFNTSKSTTTAFNTTTIQHFAQHEQINDDDFQHVQNDQQKHVTQHDDHAAHSNTSRTTTFSTSRLTITVKPGS